VGDVRGKRALDVVVAAAGLAVSAPLWLVIAVAIRLDTPGPVLHRARRVGRGGEPFELAKFRTMVVGADRSGPGITVAGDARVTRVGRALRASKLDELPQLLNVLRGEMSLVGPRPEDPRYVELYTDEQRHVLSVRPGLTSLATLEYRHEEHVLAASADPDTTYREVVLPDKLAIDLGYVERAWIGLDIVILVRTALAILRRAGSGADAGRS
jgi:lipopolysaccharide/colanic/teichoic acid biosynthesis glycosyltransferase